MPITNDAVIFGLLIAILCLVFVTAVDERFKRFYAIVPSVLLCYFLPSLLTASGLVDASQSKLYFVASRYLLPASLILLTISVDLKTIMKLGPKALIMFFTAMAGVILGGPIAILVVNTFAPDMIELNEGQELWKGMSTIAGSWIGGSANQAAMMSIFEVDKELFSKMAAVDIIVGNTWLGVLLAGVAYNQWINQKLNADNSVIEEIKLKMEHYHASIKREMTMVDLMKILAVGFGGTAIAHWLADLIAPAFAENYPKLAEYSLTSGFFWLAIFATTFGVLFSMTKVRELEGVGASMIGSLFLYVLIATIGMQMDIMAIFRNPGLFTIGICWMTIHVLLLLLVAKLIRAPFFLVSLGSTANVGGAASAPVIASAFHPSLASVGVLLAVLGYVGGTYGAYLCAMLMKLVSGG